MTVYSAYLGKLDDPAFEWEDGDWNYNVPTRVSPEFPPLHPEDHYYRIRQMIREGALDGKQTDFGGWVARVQKQTIQRLLQEWYPEIPDHPYWSKQLIGLREYVERLDPDSWVALVATEF